MKRKKRVGTLAESPDFQRVLGKGFVDKAGLPAMQIGTIVITRKQMVEELGCVSFQAARNLDNALRELGITSVRALAGFQVHKLVGVPGLHIGIEAGYVAMCLLTRYGFDPIRWAAGEKEKTVTLATIARRSRHGASETEAAIRGEVK